MAFICIITLLSITVGSIGHMVINDVNDPIIKDMGRTAIKQIFGDPNDNFLVRVLKSVRQGAGDTMIFVVGQSTTEELLRCECWISYSRDHSVNNALCEPIGPNDVVTEFPHDHPMPEPEPHHMDGDDYIWRPGGEDSFIPGPDQDGGIRTGGFTPMDVESQEVGDLEKTVEQLVQNKRGVHPNFIVKSVGVQEAYSQVVSGGLKYKLKLHLTLMECHGPGQSDCKHIPSNVSSS